MSDGSKFEWMETLHLDSSNDAIEMIKWRPISLCYSNESERFQQMNFNEKCFSQFHNLCKFSPRYRIESHWLHIFYASFFLQICFNVRLKFYDIYSFWRRKKKWFAVIWSFFLLLPLLLRLFTFIYSQLVIRITWNDNNRDWKENF